MSNSPENKVRPGGPETETVAVNLTRLFPTTGPENLLPSHEALRQIMEDDDDELRQQIMDDNFDLFEELAMFYDIVDSILEGWSEAPVQYDEQWDQLIPVEMKESLEDRFNQAKERYFKGELNN